METLDTILFWLSEALLLAGLYGVLSLIGAAQN